MTDLRKHNPLEGPRPEMSIDLSLPTDDQISIIIVHRDRPEYLNLCLQSLSIASVNHNYEVIVVDNASDKDGQDFLDEIEDQVKVIRNSENLFFSAAANKGAAAANKNSRYLVFMHCDVIIENANWLDYLTNAAESRKSGMVGVEKGVYEISGKQVEYIADWLTLFTRECWQEVGPYPEQLPLIGNTFVMSIKAANKGFSPSAVKADLAHHCKISAIDISEHERIVEDARHMIPKLLNDAQSEVIKKVL